MTAHQLRELGLYVYRRRSTRTPDKRRMARYAFILLTLVAVGTLSARLVKETRHAINEAETRRAECLTDIPEDPTERRYLTGTVAALQAQLKARSRKGETR